VDERAERRSMPEDVRAALSEADLAADFESRPGYQRNDYLWFIEESRDAETRSDRIRLLLSELAGGEVFLGMEYRPSPGRD